jgi:hypothetical protein
MFSSTLSLTSVLDGGGWLTLRPGRFTPGKETRHPFYRRLGRPTEPVCTNCPRDSSKNATKGVCFRWKVVIFVFVTSFKEVPRHVGANFINMLCSQMAVSMHGGIASWKSRSMHFKLAMYIRGKIPSTGATEMSKLFSRNLLLYYAVLHSLIRE